MLRFCLHAGQPYDFKSDVWSLGCVTYELVTGRRPFQTSRLQDLSDKVCNSQYEPITKYTAACRSCI